MKHKVIIELTLGEIRSLKEELKTLRKDNIPTVMGWLLNELER